MTQRTTPTTATPTTTPRTAEEAREPREELLSGSTPDETPKGQGVIKHDDAEDRAQEGAAARAEDRKDEPDPLKIR